MPWKKTIAVAAIIAAVVLLVVYWWVSRFDFNRLKPIITQQVRSALAREITIEEDIRLKIGFAPHADHRPCQTAQCRLGIPSGYADR